MLQITNLPQFFWPAASSSASVVAPTHALMGSQCAVVESRISAIQSENECLLQALRSAIASNTGMDPSPRDGAQVIQYAASQCSGMQIHLSTGPIGRIPQSMSHIIPHQSPQLPQQPRKPQQPQEQGQVKRGQKQQKNKDEEEEEEGGTKQQKGDSSAKSRGS